MLCLSIFTGLRKLNTKITFMSSNIYSRAMKTQHPNVHQYIKDILNILSHRISGDFMNAKDRNHIDFISFNVKSKCLYTCALSNRS